MSGWTWQLAQPGSVGNLRLKRWKDLRCSAEREYNVAEVWVRQHGDFDIFPFIQPQIYQSYDDRIKKYVFFLLSFLCDIPSISLHEL